MKLLRSQVDLSVIAPSSTAFCNNVSSYSSVHWSSEAEEEDFSPDEDDTPKAEDDETPEEEEFPDEEDNAVATEDKLPDAEESADEEDVRADDEEIPPLLSELREAEVASAELSHPAQKNAQRASSNFSHRDLDFLKNGFMEVNINSSANLFKDF